MAKAPKAKKRLPTPEKRLKTSLVLRPSVWRAARMRAIAEGCSTAHLVERAVQQYLQSAAPVRVSVYDDVWPVKTKRGG